MASEVRSTVSSSVFNLIKNVIAAGIVTLPYVLRECSTSVGLAAMLLVSGLTAWSFWLLAVCVMETHAPTYQALANLLFGPRWAWWALVILICYTLMSEISFIVVIGDFIQPTLRHLGVSGWLGSRAFVQNSIALVMLFPLSLLRDLHPLRYMSMVGLVCILYAVAVIVAEGWSDLGSPDPSVEHFSVDTSLFKGLAILSIAFAAQYSIPKLVLELGVTQKHRFRRVILIETVVVLALYIAAAVCGYFKFGEATDGDIFHNLSHADYIMVAKLSLGVSAIGCFPFPFQVLRSSLNEAFRLPTGRVFQTLFTLGLILFCAGVALAIPKIELVLAFKGSLFGSLVVYVFPGLFAWRVRQLDAGTLARVQERFRLARALQKYSQAVLGQAKYARMVNGVDKMSVNDENNRNKNMNKNNNYIIGGDGDNYDGNDDGDDLLLIKAGGVSSASLDSTAAVALLGADFGIAGKALSTQEADSASSSGEPTSNQAVWTWARLRRAVAAVEEDLATSDNSNNDKNRNSGANNSKNNYNWNSNKNNSHSQGGNSSSLVRNRVHACTSGAHNDESDGDDGVSNDYYGYDDHGAVYSGAVYGDGVDHDDSLLLDQGAVFGSRLSDRDGLLNNDGCFCDALSESQDDDCELVDPEGRVRLPQGTVLRELPVSEQVMPWFLVVFGVVTGIVGFVVTVLKMAK